MALIKCPECKKEISDKSKTCIHCGCPVENETKYYCEECGHIDLWLQSYAQKK